MFELHHLSAQEQWDWLQRGDVSPVELLEHYLTRIDRLNGPLGAFSRVDPDRALDTAKRLADRPRSLELWGLPLAEKELSRREGASWTGGSRAFADRVADGTDDIVRVLDEAGAVSVGATTAPEFGMPSYTEPLGRPAASNPYDLSLGAGGSSGGAAVAVAAGLLPFAPGSDGGGSVRIPAAATGLVGLKPTRGLVPATADSLAGFVSNGALARTVEDAAMLLDAMTARTSGEIDFLSTLRPPDPGRLLGEAVRGEGRFQIGITTSSPWHDTHEIALDPSARRALDDTIELLADRGHGLEEVPFPDSIGYAGAFETVWKAGAAAIPLGDEGLGLVEPLTAWLIREGRSLPVAALVEALATLSRFEKGVNRAWFSREGARLDAVLTPALALPPRPLGWYDPDDGAANFAQQVAYTPFTSFVNVSGLPAVTLPVSTTEQGLPMGVQLIGRPGGEATILSIGRQLERALQWQRRHPPGW
ncbi:amidase [Herbiconiux sp. L3-i23]|uniref:amidase n=1 Tax=Herbiconiux sp. L3-i23 TaxID=2905871 RepID=UPI00204CF8A4|nr:amidase [Herbiconiux sp. L3-i23]BDI23281.1 amidase [Herbiconiux sp. L3-i23]